MMIRSRWNSLKQIGCRFLRNREGVAAVEMALVTPVLLLLFCGGGEMGFYLQAHFRTAQMASTVADVVARYENVTSSDISSIFAVSSEVMGDDDFDDHGYVILTSVKREGGKAATVSWQCEAGAYENSSRIGSINKQAELPNDLPLTANDNVIVAEVFYHYTPIFTSVVAVNPLLYKTAVFRPRLGDLTAAPGCNT